MTFSEQRAEPSMQAERANKQMRRAMKGMETVTRVTVSRARTVGRVVRLASAGHRNPNGMLDLLQYDQIVPLDKARVYGQTRRICRSPAQRPAAESAHLRHSNRRPPLESDDNYRAAEVNDEALLTC